ncbi:MAG: amidohydrolase family protein [Xanthomonadales bacterium]|nr:amidohydrolase family protein [Xanthomonadales bacterium]
MTTQNSFMDRFAITRRSFVAGLAALGYVSSSRSVTASETKPPITERSGKRIDIHHHIVPESYVKAMNAAGYGTIGGVPFPKWTPDTLEHSFDVLGISKAILSISAPGIAVPDAGREKEIAREVNEYCATLMKDYGDKVGAFATIPMADMNAAISETGYALDDLALNGICLFSNHNGRYLGDPELDEFMDYLNRRKAIVFIHPTLPLKEMWPNVSLDPPLVEFVFETTRAISNMLYNGVLERYRDIRFIAAHLGGTIPFVSWRMGLFEHSSRKEMVAFRERCPRPVEEYLAQLYYEVAVSCSPGNLQNVLSFVPDDHLLFGSDYPFAAQSFIDMNSANVAGSGVLNAAQIEKVNHLNAEALFGLA